MGSSRIARVRWRQPVQDEAPKQLSTAVKSDKPMILYNCLISFLVLPGSSRGAKTTISHGGGRWVHWLHRQGKVEAAGSRPGSKMTISRGRGRGGQDVGETSNDGDGDVEGDRFDKDEWQ